MDLSELDHSDEESNYLLCEDTEEDPKPSLWTERLLLQILLAVQFFSVCTDAFLFPFFPQVAMNKGLTYMQIGLVFSSFECSRFFTSFIVGYLVGKLQPKILCISASILVNLCCLSFGLITYTTDRFYLPLCLLIRLLAGSGTAALSVSAISILIKATSYHTTTIIGLSEVLHGAGYAGGCAIGAGLYELCGYTCMFWFLGVVLTMINVGQIIIIPRLVTEQPPKKNVFTLLKIPGTLVLFTNTFCCKICGSTLLAGIGQYITTTFYKSPSVNGLLLAIWAIVFLLACPVVSWILRKGYVYSLMVSGWSFYIFACLFIGPSPLLEFAFHGKRYFLLTAILLCISGVSAVLIYVPPFQAALNLAVVNGHLKDSIQTCGMIAGIINGAVSLGGMIGPTMGGTITQVLDFTWTTTVLAGIGIFMLVVMVTYLLVMKMTRQPLAPEELNYK